MGDMADFSNEYQQSTIDQLDNYLSGDMTIQEAYDNGIINELGVEQFNSNKSITCRCCGHSGMRWGKLDKKWRLFDSDGIHKCKSNPLKR